MSMHHNKTQLREVWLLPWSMQGQPTEQQGEKVEQKKQLLWKPGPTRGQVREGQGIQEWRQLQRERPGYSEGGTDGENAEHWSRKLVRGETRGRERMRPHPGDVSNTLTMFIYCILEPSVRCWVETVQPCMALACLIQCRSRAIWMHAQVTCESRASHTGVHKCTHASTRTHTRVALT